MYHLSSIKPTYFYYGNIFHAELYQNRVFFLQGGVSASTWLRTLPSTAVSLWSWLNLWLKAAGDGPQCKHYTSIRSIRAPGPDPQQPGLQTLGRDQSGGSGPGHHLTWIQLKLYRQIRGEAKRGRGREESRFRYLTLSRTKLGAR